MKKVRLNSQVRKAFQGDSRGFTLIEVLVAIALMGTIAIAVLSALSTASLALITADMRATAESLARSQMEFVKNQGYNSTLVNGQVTYPKIPDIPGGYTICSCNRTGEPVNCGAGDRVIGVPWDSNTGEPYQPPSQDNGLQKIELVIKNNNKILITLEGYKRKPTV